MSELLPSAQAREIRDGLLNYLTTTFALADPMPSSRSQDFLSDREHGIFKGPFLRLRLPFRAAADGWQSILGWDIGLTPCCPSLNIPMKAALVIPMWGCGKAPRPGWLRGLGGGGAGGRG